jgi:surface protein
MANMFSYATGLNSNILTISNWNYSAITPAANFNNFIQLAKVSPSRVSALMTAFSQSSRIGNVALATMPAYVPLSTTVTNALTAKNITFTANTNYATFLSTYTVAQFYAANWLVTDISSRNFTVTELKTGGYSLSQISAGYSISQITSAGYTLSQLIADGVSVSDLSGNYTIQELTTAGATLSQIRAVYSFSQMVTAGYTLSEIYPQGVSLSDLSNVTIPKSTWVSSGQTVGNLVSAGYTPARLLTNSFTLSEVTPFYNGRLFVFDVSSSVWNGTYPITNTGGSLAGLINSSATVGNVVTATSTWTSYSKLNVNDGLFFSNRVTYGYNKSVNVRQYGGIPLANMTSSNSNKGTFDGFTGVITATDAPTIPNNSLYSCFFSSTASTFGNLNAWDVSGVTNMDSTFYGTSLFNQPINTWNTGNVTTMFRMFNYALVFNQPLNNWNVSKVTNMSTMFDNARAFNQPLNNWNTGNVTLMDGMLSGQYNGTSIFNSDISTWNTSKVTNMSNMFTRNSLFNQPIGNWNTGNVTTMERMFYGATNFNQPIGNWNTSKVTNMGQMFGGLSFFNNFNQPIGNWDTGNVTNMNWMFSTTNFNQPIGNWNISKVTRLDGMFYRNRSFNQPLNDWNTGNVTTINAMFAKVSNDPFMTFNQPLDKWNTSKMTDIYAFSQLPMNDNILSLKNWNFSSVLSTNFSGWFSFYISPSITTQLFAALSQNPTLNNVNFGAIDPAYTPIPIDVSNALAAKGIRYTPNDKYNISLSTWAVHQFDPAVWLVTDFSSRNFTIAQLKSRGYSLPQISTAYSISQMLSAGQQLSDLSNCSYKKSQWTAANYSPRQLQSAGFSLPQLLQAEFALSDLSGTTYTSTQWTQSNVTSQQLSNAGFKTTQLVTAGFSVPTFSFQISQSAFLSGNAQIPVVNTGGSFQGLDSSYNTVNATSNINIYWMSYTNNSPQDGLSLISTSYFNEPSINITKFSGIPLAFMSGTNSAAFYQFSGQITATDVPTIPNRSLNACFYGSTSATLGNINGWDISNVTDLTSMFQNNTAFNTSLSNWNTRNVVSMRNTFSGCSAFSKDISMWDLSGVIPTISQGSMYNIIHGTALNPDTVSVFLLNIINRYTA